MRNFLIFFTLWAMVAGHMAASYAADYQHPVNGVLLRPISPNNDKTGYHSRGIGAKGIKKIWNNYNPREERKAAALAAKEEEKREPKSSKGIGKIGGVAAASGTVLPDSKTQPEITPVESDGGAEVAETMENAENAAEDRESADEQAAPSTGGIGTVGGIGSVGGAGMQSE